MNIRGEYISPTGFRGDPQEPTDFLIPVYPDNLPGAFCVKKNPAVQLVFAALILVGCGGAPASVSQPESADAAPGVTVIFQVPREVSKNQQPTQTSSSTGPLVSCPTDQGKDMRGSYLVVNGRVVKVCTLKGWEDPNILTRLENAVKNFVQGK